VIQTDVRTDAAAVLQRCQMPDVEIEWVLTADDPAVVHMVLELHRERLEEELAERRKMLTEVERNIAEGPVGDGGRRRHRRPQRCV
jgi:hypothetical protein